MKKAGSKNGTATIAQPAFKPITSFFSPKSKPAVEPDTKSSKETSSWSEAKTPSPNRNLSGLTDSSTVKTRTKFVAPPLTEPEIGLGSVKTSDNRARDSANDDDDDNGLGSVARKIDTDHLVSEKVGPDLLPTVGAIVEVLFDDGKWYRGHLTAQNKSGSWHVEFSEDGDETDITFPDPEVRIISSKDEQRPRRASAARGRKRLVPESSDDESRENASHSDGKSTYKAAKAIKKVRHSRVHRTKSTSDSDDKDSEYRMEEDPSASEESMDEEVSAGDDVSDGEVFDKPRRRVGRTSRTNKHAAKTAKTGYADKTPGGHSSVVPQGPNRSAASGGAAAVPIISTTAGARSANCHIVSEHKKEKAAKFEAKNQERWAPWSPHRHDSPLRPRSAP